MDYELLRGLADSYGLVLLTAIFIFVVLFVFRRGSSDRYRDAAAIPFRNEKARSAHLAHEKEPARPAQDVEPARPALQERSERPSPEEKNDE